MTVEHHQFLPQLRKWIKSGEVKTPFNILNIDEHHDYYGNFCRQLNYPTQQRINCGNWGYHLPTSWYNRFTWVHNRREQSHNWTNAQKWLKSKNIKSSTRTKHCLPQLRSKIIAAIFCVSPDFMETKTLQHTSAIIEIVADHFDIKKVPTRVKYSTTTPRTVKGWQIRSRKEVPI